MLKGLARKCIPPTLYRQYTSDGVVVDEERLTSDEVAEVTEVRLTLESDPEPHCWKWCRMLAEGASGLRLEG